MRTNDDMKPGGNLPAGTMNYRRAFMLSELIALRVRDRSGSADSRVAADAIAAEIRDVAASWCGAAE